MTWHLKSQHLYEPLEEVERLENYQHGGHHRVKISDQFHHGRYRYRDWNAFL